MIHQKKILCLVFYSVVAASGCGGKKLEGTLSINGKPVPSGNLILTPNIDQNNDGPTIYADVVDGKLTAVKGSRITTGPCKVVANVSSRWLKKGETELKENEPITQVRGECIVPESGSLTLDLKFDLTTAVKEEGDQ